MLNKVSCYTVLVESYCDALQYINCLKVVILLDCDMKLSKRKVTEGSVVYSITEWDGICCHGSEVMGTNPGWVELGGFKLLYLSQT